MSPVRTPRLGGAFPAPYIEFAIERDSRRRDRELAASSVFRLIRCLRLGSCLDSSGTAAPIRSGGRQLAEWTGKVAQCYLKGHH